MASARIFMGSDKPYSKDRSSSSPPEISADDGGFARYELYEVEVVPLTDTLPDVGVVELLYAYGLDVVGSPLRLREQLCLHLGCSVCSC